mmetsp:Transcript_13871/g.37740  ORF Transcript_13871/g.37740 Transcript_13871/m.37740 type:complete len:255 (-) Transcript_13871:195-959(-)
MWCLACHCKKVYLGTRRPLACFLCAFQSSKCQVMLVSTRGMRRNKRVSATCVMYSVFKLYFRFCQQVVVQVHSPSRFVLHKAGWQPHTHVELLSTSQGNCNCHTKAGISNHLPSPKSSTPLGQWHTPVLQYICLATSSKVSPHTWFSKRTTNAWYKKGKSAQKILTTVKRVVRASDRDLDVLWFCKSTSFPAMGPQMKLPTLMSITVTIDLLDSSNMRSLTNIAPTKHKQYAVWINATSRFIHQSFQVRSKSSL